MDSAAAELIFVSYGECGPERHELQLDRLSHSSVQLVSDSRATDVASLLES